MRDQNQSNLGRKALSLKKIKTRTVVLFLLILKVSSGILYFSLSHTFSSLIFRQGHLQPDCLKFSLQLRMISNVGFSCLPNAGFTAGCHLAPLFPLFLLFGMGAWSKNFNRVAYRITTRRLFIGARPPHQGLHYRGKLFFTSTTSNFQELSREVWSLRRASTQAIGYNYSGNGGTF